jgi:hypothetical protein
VKIFVLFILILVLLGCAKTRMTYYEDPDFKDIEYKSLVVMSGFHNLEDRMYMETTFCKYLQKFQVTCKRGVDIFPPTRTHTDSEFVAAFQSSDTEGIVFINLTDSYSTQSWIPPTTRTTSTITSYANNAYFNATTNTSGGYAISKPVEKYEVFVVDGASAKKSIIASGTTKGNAFAKPANLSKSLAATFVKYLYKNGAIVKQ